MRDFSIMEHSIHGQCVVKGVSWHEYMRYKTLFTGFFDIIPMIYEFYEFNHYTVEESTERLKQLGFDERFKIIQQNKANDSIVIMKYVGEPILDKIVSLKIDEIKQVMMNFSALMGKLHAYGIIAGDTHEEQFLVDNNLEVWRVDIESPYILFDKFIQHNFIKKSTIEQIKIKLDLVSCNFFTSNEKFIESVNIEKNFMLALVNNIINYYNIDDEFYKEVEEKYYKVCNSK